jgi:hypothetical protein
MADPNPNPNFNAWTTCYNFSFGPYEERTLEEAAR